jgi:hypothetical protein
LAKREVAEKALIEIGPDVLPLLPAVTPRTPAEDKIRLQRVRSALVNAAIAAATKPSIVTLAGEMPFSEAIAKIAEQTGNKLVDYRERFNQGGADPKIKVSLEKEPFWKALDTVLDAAGLTIYNYDEEQAALAFTSRGDNAPPRLGRGDRRRGREAARVPTRTDRAGFTRRAPASSPARRDGGRATRSRARRSTPPSTSGTRTWAAAPSITTTACASKRPPPEGRHPRELQHRALDLQWFHLRVFPMRAP